MAKILRGGYAGVLVTVQQWCNDWFIVDTPTRTGVVCKPTSLELDVAEVARVLADRDAGGTGVMFELFDLDQQTGRFKRKKSMAQLRHERRST